MIVPAVTASGCLFHGVWGFCVSVRVPLQLFLLCHFQSDICRSSSTGALLLIGCQDQCSCGFVQVSCVLFLYVFVISCVCMMHNVCIVLGSSLVFLVFFLLCVDREKRFIIFILSQHYYVLYLVSTVNSIFISVLDSPSFSRLRALQKCLISSQLYCHSMTRTTIPRHLFNLQHYFLSDFIYKDFWRVNRKASVPFDISVRDEGRLFEDIGGERLRRIVPRCLVESVGFWESTTGLCRDTSHLLYSQFWFVIIYPLQPTARAKQCFLWYLIDDTEISRAFSH